jgi:hypothetical protein
MLSFECVISLTDSQSKSTVFNSKEGYDAADEN